MGRYDTDNGAIAWNESFVDLLKFMNSYVLLFRTINLTDHTSHTSLLSVLRHELFSEPSQIAVQFSTVLQILELSPLVAFAHCFPVKSKRLLPLEDALALIAVSVDPVLSFSLKVLYRSDRRTAIHG
jgi:hypothetical protein